MANRLILTTGGSSGGGGGGGGGGGNTTKFNPSHGMSSDQEDGNSVATGGNGNNHAEIVALGKTGTNSTTYAGSNLKIYAPNYHWGNLEPNNGPVNGYNFNAMVSDFNDLQASCPGCRFSPIIFYAQYGNYTRSSTPYIPADILSGSGFGAGPTGGSGSTFGWALSGYNGNGTWAVTSAAIWRAAVYNRWIAMILAFGNHSFTTTAGPYAGQTFTFNTHPLVESFFDGAEYSWSFGNSVNYSNPAAPADYNDDALTAALEAEMSQIKVGLTQTQFALYLSYGDSGVNAYRNLNILVQYAAANGCSISNADIYQNVNQINGQAFYCGSANGTGVSPTPDNRSVMAYAGNCQPLDYNGGNGNNPAAAMATIYATAQTLQCRYIYWAASDDGVHGSPTTFIPTYIKPFVDANPTVPSSVRPTNLP